MEHMRVTYSTTTQSPPVRTAKHHRSTPQDEVDSMRKDNWECSYYVVFVGNFFRSRSWLLRQRDDGLFTSVGFV